MSYQPKFIFVLPKDKKIIIDKYTSNTPVVFDVPPLYRETDAWLTVVFQGQSTRTKLQRDREGRALWTFRDPFPEPGNGRVELEFIKAGQSVGGKHYILKVIDYYSKYPGPHHAKQ